MSCRSLGFYALAAGKRCQLGWTGCDPLRRPRAPPAPPPQEGVFSASTATSS
jgi:hypothetical protein